MNADADNTSINGPAADLSQNTGSANWVLADTTVGNHLIFQCGRYSGCNECARCNRCSRFTNRINNNANNEDLDAVDGREQLLQVYSGMINTSRPQLGRHIDPDPGSPIVGTAFSPTADHDAVNDLGEEFADVDNTNRWTKTHYGELSGRTVGTNYTYGDNIYYQGKHYIYTSHLDSNDPIYVSPADDGYTEFDDLLRLGAIRELPMYVDTIGGGGGAGLPEGVYYRPNQDLNFVDRLANSGIVRTNSVERRTDAPLPPGDEIFNSQDDQFFGGINAGNDGIYGTLDDFYATTADPNVAMNGGHIDADADNNKDLLNTENGLENFSVADFVDYIQTLANVRAVNGGTQSRLVYANRILEETEINLGAATSRIMDADMAYESTKMAQQNVLLQAGASMVTQANQLSNIVLSLLQ